MKAIKLIVTVMCVSVFALFLLGAECGVPEEVVDSLPAYYIIFKADGELKTYSKGFTDFNGDACGNYVSSETTQIVALPVASALVDGPLDEYFLIIFPGQESYDSVYFQYGDGSGDVYITPGPEISSVTITKYEDEGGVIEGTFSGMVTLDTDIDITEGKFKVKRVPDDSFDASPGPPA